MDSDILTLVEAARMLRIRKETLAKLATAKRVPARKLGHQWRFSRLAIEQWMAGVKPALPAREKAVA